MAWASTKRRTWPDGTPGELGIFNQGGLPVWRQGKHVVMTDGVRKITIPRHNPVNAITMAGIVGDAGLTVEDSRKLI
ncbi:MAG TPA: hypothetical protein VL523_17615 [Terriglobia bacterium]|nr:hypothetical protein [Terriglobia bacterium]